MSKNSTYENSKFKNSILENSMFKNPSSKVENPRFENSIFEMVYQIHTLYNFFIMYLFNKVMWKLKNKLIHNFNLSKISLLKNGLCGCWTSCLTKAKHDVKPR